MKNEEQGHSTIDRGRTESTHSISACVRWFARGGPRQPYYGSWRARKNRDYHNMVLAVRSRTPTTIIWLSGSAAEIGVNERRSTTHRAQNRFRRRDSRLSVLPQEKLSTRTPPENVLILNTLGARSADASVSQRLLFFPFAGLASRRTSVARYCTNQSAFAPDHSIPRTPM